MAPKNEKKEKPVKGDEAEQVGGVELGTLTKTILDYLRSVRADPLLTPGQSPLLQQCVGVPLAPLAHRSGRVHQPQGQGHQA